MTFTDIIHIVIILSAISVGIFILIYLKKLFEQVNAVRADIHRFVENAIPILNNLEDVSLRADRVVAEIEGYWNEIDRIIRTIRQSISNLRPWKKINELQTLTSEFSKTLKSVARGISAFRNGYKHG